VEGDLVAEGFQVVDVVADGPLRAAAGVVAAGAEVDEVGLGSDSRCQPMTRMERPPATMAFFLPRRRPIRRYRSPRKVSVLPAETAGRGPRPGPGPGSGCLCRWRSCLSSSRRTR
jgi:hypothetical protein